VAMENNQENTTITAADANLVDEAVKKYLPYLKEIQKKLIILLIVILASGLSGFFYYQKILSFVLKLFNLKGITIVLSSPYQFVELSINTGIATGIIISLPLLLYYILGFLKPALAKKEFQILQRLVPIALVLFVIGFGFGAWVMQFVINMYSQTAVDFNITNIWDISHFFSQTIIMGLCLGLMFELPVILTLLLALNLIKKQTVSKNRRYVYAGIVLVAALLPPNDVISLSILTFVPLLLFEITLILNKSK
jgi:sec-independent protein translocase protein TatC